MAVPKKIEPRSRRGSDVALPRTGVDLAYERTRDRRARRRPLSEGQIHRGEARDKTGAHKDPFGEGRDMGTPMLWWHRTQS